MRQTLPPTPSASPALAVDREDPPLAQATYQNKPFTLPTTSRGAHTAHANRGCLSDMLALQLTRPAQHARRDAKDFNNNKSRCSTSFENEDEDSSSDSDDGEEGEVDDHDRSSSEEEEEEEGADTILTSSVLLRVSENKKSFCCDTFTPLSQISTAKAPETVAPRAPVPTSAHEALAAAVYPSPQSQPSTASSPTFASAPTTFPARRRRCAINLDDPPPRSACLQEENTTQGSGTYLARRAEKRVKYELATSLQHAAQFEAEKGLRDAQFRRDAATSLPTPPSSAAASSPFLVASSSFFPTASSISTSTLSSTSTSSAASSSSSSQDEGEAWLMHEVKKEETLSALAHHYNVELSSICRANQLPQTMSLATLCVHRPYLAIPLSKSSTTKPNDVRRTMDAATAVH